MDSESLEPSSSHVCEDEDSNAPRVYIPPDESSSTGIEVESSNIFHSFQITDNNSEAEVIHARNLSTDNDYLGENFLDLKVNNEVSHTDNNDIGPSIIVADASFASNFIEETERKKSLNENNPGCSSSSSNLSCESSRHSYDLNLGSEALSNNEEILIIQHAPSECDPHSSKGLPQLSKQADSNCLEKFKSKHKGGKGLKGTKRLNLNLSQNILPDALHNQEQNVERDEILNQRLSNKHSLFARLPRSWIRNTDYDNRSVPVSYDSDSSCEEVFGCIAPVQTSSPSHHTKKIKLCLNDNEESFIVASSSERNAIADTFYVKSPKSSEDAFVSSSTGQLPLDQLPGTSMNFQVNDVSNSSSISSPINPPVLDSTVDSTSGQNISSPFSEMDEVELDFHCRLEERNEISTSEQHIPDVDMEHNILQRSPEASPVPHYIQDYLNLENLDANNLKINQSSDEISSAEASALIPSSSVYLQEGAKDNIICLPSNKSFPESTNDTSNAPSPCASENLNILSVNENLTFPVDTSTSEDRQNILSLDMGVIEVPSSSLASTTSNFQNNFEASGSGVDMLKSSSHDYRSSQTLAQINEDYMLGIVENPLNSEDVLPEANDELPEDILQLNERVTIQTVSDREGNFQNSIELSLISQNLGPFVVSQPDQQILIHPDNILADCPHLESSNIEFIGSGSFEPEETDDSESDRQVSNLICTFI